MVPRSKFRSPFLGLNRTAPLQKEVNVVGSCRYRLFIRQPAKGWSFKGIQNSPSPQVSSRVLLCELLGEEHGGFAMSIDLQSKPESALKLFALSIEEQPSSDSSGSGYDPTNPTCFGPYCEAIGRRS